MKEMQFTAMVLMLILASTLVVLLPRRVMNDSVLNRSRWLMVGGISLVAIQFMLQYVFGFRQMGVTQAVMVNLLFFIPCSSLFNLSILNLQQKGSLLRFDVLAGLATCVGAVIAIATAAYVSGDALADTKVMQWAEYTSGLFYCLMQSYYVYRLFVNNRQLKKTLNDYYEYQAQHLLRWMNQSVILMGLMACCVPFLIFSSGLLLLIYALLIFFSIYYITFSFICYCVSNDSHQVELAQQNAKDEGIADKTEKNEPAITDAELQRVTQAVEKWLAAEGHLRSSITVATAATAMHVPQRLLRAWYQTEGFDSYSDWLQQLRVKHAKQLLVQHPEWSVDTIAEQCGFSSRNYFHRIFLKLTGQTPSQYVASAQEK
jgi:AraC-like DNA-binding protein